MARKPATAPNDTIPSITLERAARLYQMVGLLGQKPQTRNALTKKLALGIRGFYRDLEVLRQVQIAVTLTNRRYSLDGAADEAQARLPFPDPGLSLAEAKLLAKGRTKVHAKLRKLLATIVEG